MMLLLSINNCYRACIGMLFCKRTVQDPRWSHQWPSRFRYWSRVRALCGERELPQFRLTVASQRLQRRSRYQVPLVAVIYGIKMQGVPDRNALLVFCVRRPAPWHIWPPCSGIPGSGGQSPSWRHLWRADVLSSPAWRAEFCNFKPLVFNCLLVTANSDIPENHFLNFFNMFHKSKKSLIRLARYRKNVHFCEQYKNVRLVWAVKLR